MWASTIRYQGSVGGKLRSLHWNSSSCECESGWLASGSEEGGVGVSWITREGSPCNSSCVELPINGSLYKSNFNLRGHIGGVRLVRWRPQGDRLATYDSWGNIKIWKNRANILAIDYESTTTVHITDMQWSKCGFYIAICGEEGHIQMLSGLNGVNIFAVQVIAATVFSFQAQFVSLSWNKQGTRIALGTERGEVMDVDPAVNGQFISTMMVRENTPVLHIQYFGPVQEVEIDTPGGVKQLSTQSLSLYLANGEVAIFPNLTTTDCMCVHTRIINGQAAWNKAETVLAIVGYQATSSTSSLPFLVARFLNSEGNILFSLDHLLMIQPGTETLLQCICWGLEDSTLLIAYNNHLFSVDILPTIPTLHRLCREYIATTMWRHNQFTPCQLPLPSREINALDATRPSLLPPLIDTSGSFQPLFTPLPQNTRLHCIMVPEDEERGQANTYYLKYEHFGSYIPLLRAQRRVGKLYNIKWFIKPTFLSKEDKSKREEEHYWGSVVESDQIRSERNQNTRRVGSLFRRFRSLAGSVMDVPSTDNPESCLEQGELHNQQCCSDHFPVIAEIEGNILLRRYKFLTPLYHSSVFGTLNIRTYYMSCEPRQFTVTLTEGSNSNILYSKNPEWNPRFRIFELDFGGRINRDSVKNFQIEKDSEVVLQFGRSSFGHFCLDFQHPFSPVAAFCVALSSIV